MKQILVADVAGGVETLRHVVGPAAEIVGAATLDEALAALRDGVDLVICGIHFDQSRMFDLLRLAKADRATRDTPFVCFRHLDSELPQQVFESLQIACVALGAIGFVDLFELRSRYGVHEADTRLRATVFAHIDV